MDLSFIQSQKSVRVGILSLVCWGGGETVVSYLKTDCVNGIQEPKDQRGA